MRIGDVDVEVLVRVHVENASRATLGSWRASCTADSERLRRRARDRREDLVPHGVVQRSRLLFLTRYCCWDPLTTTLRENCESAMTRPLA